MMHGLRISSFPHEPFGDSDSPHLYMEALLFACTPACVESWVTVQQRP